MKYTVKNFRVFDQEGFEFDLSNPITFLTGCNSSGKSSLVKSLLLLNNYMDGLREDYRKTNDFNLAKHTLGLSKSTLQLGDYKSVLNRKENDGLLHFSYTIQPEQALIPFTVEYVFGENCDDLTNDASLKQLIITSSDEKLLQLSVKDKKLSLDYANLLPMKEDYLKYAYYQMVEMLVSADLSYSAMGDESGYSADLIEKMQADIEITKKRSRMTFAKKEIQSFENYFANNQNNKLDDWYSLAKSIQQSMIFYSPVMGILADCSKSEVGIKIRELLVEKDEDLEAVVSAFEKSPFDSFADYFKDLEHKQALVFGKRHADDCGFLSSVSRLFTNNYDFVWHDNDPMSWGEPIDLFDEEKIVKKTPEEKEIARKQREQRYQAYLKEERENVNFDFVNKSLWKLSTKIDEIFKSYFEHYDMRDGFPHPGYSSFITYVRSVFKSLLIPANDFANVKYINSESAKIRRLYSLDEDNNSFVRTLSKYKDAKRDYDNNKKYVPDTFLNEWLQKFGIAHHAEIKSIEEGLGVTIRLYADENDKTGHLLADEGYGMTQLFNILLAIETVALSNSTHYVFSSDERYVSEHRVGDFIEENDYSLMTIEEPENHLHPNYQSLLAEMFYDAFKRFNIHFIVETHSEYMIRKSQLIVAGMNFTSNDEAELNSPFKTYYVSKIQSPYSLGYRKDGKFKENFGTGFYDESSNLVFELL